MEKSDEEYRKWYENSEQYKDAQYEKWYNEQELTIEKSSEKSKKS